MHRCSETIGAIAAALAKAQAELTNPEKSLIATIRSPSEEDQTFRYAPLSNGLEIVRKCLGRHEIAAMQTTAIDQEAGLIRLTTVLAHSSGEWVSSDWPICPVSETAAPRRMGAALTYARRYALFTLVGIAGEDDIDAPDLGAPAAVPSEALNTRPRSPHGTAQSAQLKQSAAPKLTLETEQSAKLRDALVSDIERLSSADDAALWAHRNLAVKNTLKAADATAVERAFEVRLTVFDQTRSDQLEAERGKEFAEGATSPTPDPLGSRPVLQKSIRLRDKEHCKFVAMQPCLVCGRAPSDPHHLRFAQPRALGRKVSDEFTVPLCRVHHRELHRRGDEAAWWHAIKIDPMPLALRLWRRTRLNRTGVSVDGADDARE